MEKSKQSAIANIAGDKITYAEEIINNMNTFSV